MKKLLMALFALCVALGAKAQEDSASLMKGQDFTFSYQSESKSFGYKMGSDDRDLPLYLVFSANGSFQKLSTYSMILGVGTSKRFLIADGLLLQGMIYPYVGYLMYDTEKFKGYDKRGNPETEIKLKTKFAYGAAANVDLGIRVWKSEETNRQSYITIGYYVGVPEFKTKDLFKNGAWCVGLTILDF